MQAGLSPAPSARACHRHELRALTYVTLDQANGGIIRNLTHAGVAVQAAAALYPGQQLRVRFELLHPLLRIDTCGEVMWTSPGGLCGIRFLDLPPRMVQRIDEWILGNLLGNAPRDSSQAVSVLSVPTLVTTPLVGDTAEDDGLIVSPAAVKVIELPVRSATLEPVHMDNNGEAPPGAPTELDWLSQPLSARGITWLVNTLTVLAALLLFALVFLSVVRETPKWPVAMTAGAAIAVAAFYWGFFKLFGGVSPGARLARLAGYDREDEEEPGSARFR
jgi:hypothetical protein